MEESTWKKDNLVRIWNNALAISFYVLLILIFAGTMIGTFVQKKDNYGSLVAGILFLLLAYEMFVNSYMRVTYLNGRLEFYKALKKYSLFFRKRNHRIEIHPEEWTEMFCRSYKGGSSYFLRNGKMAAYFVKAEGMNLLYRDLVDLFPGRVKYTAEPFPWDIRRNLRKAAPERVV